MKHFMNVVIAFWLAFAVLACQTTPKCGTEVRGAFDIGSGATKVKVVELDTCTQTVVREILDDQAKVDYRESLDQSKDNSFSPQIKKIGFDTILRLKEQASQGGAKQFTAVATAAFRQAKNGDQYADEISKAAEMPVEIVTQDQEALLGAHAARQKLPANTQVVVWDIGGGSQQMTALKDHHSAIYYGDLASVSFKNKVIQDIQKKNIQKVVSPNPMTKAQVDSAVKFATEKAKSSVPESIQTLLKSRQNVVVVGIGGVLAKSLPRQLGTQIVSLDEITQAIEKRHRMTDQQLNDPYAATEITNLVLVKGFMEALGIQTYQAMEVGLVDGLWFDSRFWKPAN